MLCPNCQHEVNPGATFCGNCGYHLDGPVPSHPAHTQAAPNSTGSALPPPPPVPAGSAAAVPTHDGSEQAVASFVLGILGCIGWLIPIVGTIMGIVAILLGAKSQKSRHKSLSTIGIILGTLVTLTSLFFWIAVVEKAVSDSNKSSSSSSTSANSSLQTVATPCYTTKIPQQLKVNKASSSCTFSALSNVVGEEYEIKVINVPQLNSTNLQQAAVADASNAINATPGGSISGQSPATFAGNPAYKITLKATDGSAGTIDYIYKQTAQGNLVIVMHIKTNGQNYDLSSIEKYWLWQ